MIQAVLADDEVLARQKLRQLLREFPEIEVAGEGATAAETIALVRATKPDLLFLDVRMPDMDGFDVVGELAAAGDPVMPSIIFTTAYDKYALRAFEIHAVDYLLKPFTLDRFRSATQRALDHIRSSRQHPDAAARKNPKGTPYTTRIVFKSKGRILFLPVSEICWIGAEENYVRICTQSETHLLRETMTRLEEKLDPTTFLRVHRSSIVNLQYVKEVRPEVDGEYGVHLLNGQKIPMSRTYRSRIKNWLER
ncbi:LytTR family DNA-binding domain-containing protein [Edaphobacter sp. 12200R-103]|jgi:two-component system LytT family response regulator|uniref:LytR/AlgR family response regulator transcription factor n=1 Tax=Edaphobacter sp. 12200R-103 TaxID=2703788 RepID=UPI00138D8F49|nr:LytTR family DNA-binding domain-containing protein [Edaphobacter sp. 12200R-103]QHS53212.1 response regulator transcription factor [Edaphobacter sp. 12200R-103]